MIKKIFYTQHVCNIREINTIIKVPKNLRYNLINCKNLKKNYSYKNNFFLKYPNMCSNKIMKNNFDRLLSWYPW